MKRLNRFILLALVYPFAVAKVLGRRLLAKQESSLPEAQDRSLFEKLRSPKVVRRVGLGLVLVMASTFAALQAIAVDTGADSTIDYALATPGGSATSTGFAQGPSSSFPDLSTNATWEAWLYPTDAVGYDHFINKEFSFTFALVDGVYQWAFGNGSAWSNPSWYSTSIVAPLNTWQHAAFIKSGSNLKFYLNGALAFETTLTYSALASSTSQPLTVGGRIANSHFAGRIDEVRIWNSARSATQIATAMHQNYKTVGTPSDLLGYWDFNEPDNIWFYNRATAVAATHLTFQGTPSRVDVKQVTYVSGGDTVVTFPRTYLPGTGTWTAPTGASKSRALVVAGGGGGGGWEDGGGGGAGGVVEFASLTLSATLKVVVGQGGNGGYAETSDKNHGINGQDTSLGTVIAIGGGAGGGYGYSAFLSRAQGTAGGSGGGHGEYGTSLAAAAGLQKTDATTYSGGVEYGNASGAVNPAMQAGSGGGGAGSVGGDSTTFQVGGAGGTGMSSTIAGTAAFYAAGGGGADRSGAGALGGSSIGGNGGGTSQRTHAVANTGSGGGGAAATGLRSGGNGSAGIVIIRYSPTLDLAWNKGNLDGEYAFLNNASDPVIPTASNAAWTAEAWVRPDSFAATWTNLFGQQVNADPYSGRNSIWLNNGQVVLVAPSADYATGYFLPLNRWTHVAWVMTTTASSQLYVDGNLVWDGSVTRGTGGTHFAIGGSRQTGHASFDGNIDQFKVWGVNLTGTQVANSMHAHGATFTGAPSASCVTGLRAHYDFNEFIAGTVTDRSGCGRHLAFNTGVAGSYAESNFTSSAIIETGTAHSLQTYVKFNRSYLTASGGWTRPGAASLVKSLVVAGGGGGGAWVGAGGGAGGATTTASTLLSSSVVTVTVGQGGRGARFDGTSFVDVGSNGQNSSFGSLSATGGGRGGSWQNAPSAGGSGGGGVGFGAGSILIGAAPTSGQGFKGGDGNSTTYYSSGGGGGAGGAGQDGQASPKKSGNGGAGITTALTGAVNGIQLAGGGGGGGHEANDVAGSATFGGGAGAVRTTTQATSGTQNTGGGGGGSGNPSGGVGWSSQGGNGGSGVVILSYGAIMDVVQTPGGARAGTAFARPITVQLKNADGTNNAAAGVSVTLAAASASVLQQTVSGTTSNVTSVIATSDANGLVTFSGLGFQSGVGTPAQTLTVTSDAFVGTTLSVAPTFVSSSITVTNSGTTAGEFVNGVFQATAASATNILASDLITALAGSNVLVESAGNITVSAGLTSTATNSLTLTCSGTGAFTNSGGAISTASDLSVSCATVTTSATITTSGTGGVSLTAHTGLMSVGAAISSAKDITLLPKTTYAGAGSLTATTATAGFISISGGTSVAPTGAIRASGYVALFGSGAITNSTATLTSTASSVSVASSASTVNISAIVSAATTASLTASSTVTTSAAVGATAGVATVTSTAADLSIGGAISGTSVALVPKTGYAGAGALTATAGTVQISGGSTVDPTGAIQASGNVVLRGSGQITTATNATITSTAGSVEVTTTGGLVTLGKNVLASTSISISLTGAYSGVGTLTATNETVSISGGTTVAPTGSFTAAGNITISGSARVTIASQVQSTGGAVSITGGTLASTDGGLYLTGSVVTNSGAITLTGNAGASWGTYLENNSSVSTTTGNITIAGNAPAGVWGVRVREAKVLSTSGDIRISGGASYGLNMGYLGTSDIGAIPTGVTSNSSVTLIGNTYEADTAVRIRTSGPVVIESTAAQFTGAITVTSHTFTGNSSLRIGQPTNTKAVTVTGSVNVVNDYTVYGGAITQTAPVTTSAGSIYMYPTGAYSGAGALTVTTSPVTSAAGNVSITGGTSIAPTGSIQATGNITLSGSGQINLSSISVGSSAGQISVTAGSTSTSPAINVSAATISAPAGRIDLTGTSSGDYGIYVASSSTIATTSGAINITGVGATWGVGFGAADITSTSGAISVDGGTKGIVNGNGATTTFGATSSGTASGDITVLGDQYWGSSTGVVYKTTGAVVLNSKAANYIAAPTYNNHTFTGASSVTIGSLSAAHQVTVDATGTITGQFTVLGQYVYLDGGTSLITNRGAASSGSPNIGFLAKATDRIYMGAGADVETKGSDIVFWSDSDNSGVGSQYFARSTILKSNGGQITMAGGLDDGAALNAEFVGRFAGDGHPDNYASGNTFGENAGVEFLNSYELLSGGGDVFIAGRGSAVAGDSDMGISLRGGLIYSGAGKIAAYGKSPESCTNSWHRGITTGWTAQTHIISDSPAEDAIYLYGNTASCNSGGSVYASAVEISDSWANIATPNGGGIKIYGIQGDASYNSPNSDWQSNTLQLKYINLISNSGPITMHAVNATTASNLNIRFAQDSNSRRTIGALASSWATGYPAYPTIAAVASTSNITLKADSMKPGWATFRTAGALKFIPNTTFASSIAHYFSSDWGIQIPLKLASFTVGAPAAGSTAQSSADIDLVSVSSTGPIAVYGGAITYEGTLASDEDVTLSGTKDVTLAYAVTAGDAALIQTSGGDVLVNASTTAGAGGITYKASRDVLVNTTTKSITTSAAGNIVFWGNSGGTGGEVDTGGPNVTIDSNGGDIVIAGGADNGANGGVAADNIPDNTLLGRTLAHTARLKASMASGAGDIIVRAQHFAGTTTNAFGAVYVPSSVQLTATTGDILIEGSQNAGNISTGNQYGVWIGGSTTGASLAVLKSDSGNVTINGDASQSNRSQRRGVLLYGAEIVATLGNIELNGSSPNTTESFDVLGWATSTVTAGGNITVSGARTSATEFTTFNAGGVTTLSVGLLIGGDAGTNTNTTTTSVPTAFAGTGSVVIESNGTSFNAAQTMANVTITSTVTGLTVGKSGNTAGVTLPAAYSIAGDINLIGGAVAVNANQTATSAVGSASTVGRINVNAASFSNPSTLTTSNKDITINADQATIGAAVNSGSAITTLTGNTAARPIDLGAADSATLLGLTDAELDLITAGTIRVGDATSGNVNVSAPITIASAKSTTLAIRSGGDVGKTGTGSIAVANLGIDAVGTITLGGGHSISGNLALNGSGATFSQTSMNYTPNTVDTIAASFGTGYALSVTAIPAVNSDSTDQFMAVTFNPPPVATVKDKYSNSLETNNNLSDAYQVTVTKTSGAGTLEGTKVINAVLGVATFTDLKITGNTGDHDLNFALAPITGTATFGTSSVDSGTYNVQAGDPDNLNVLTPASGGTSGAAFTTQPVIQIRDVANNLVALDPGKSAVVTATVSAGGTIVGSETATAVNSVATFAGLGIKGLVSGSYTITYSIVFNSATISKAQTALTIASGVATTLEVAQPASVSNAVVFGAQPVVTAKDSAGNTATTQVGTVTVANGSLTGTKTKALVDGVASFAGQDLKLTGTIGTYPLTYTMGSLSTISGVQLTHGVATQLSLSTPAAGFVNRQVFDTAPVITVLDVSNNPVLNSAVEITVESTNAVLSGTVTMPAADGIANFANKGLKLTGTVGAQVLTYKATDLTSASQSFDLLHGAAYELRLVTDGAGAKAGIKFTTSPRVEILDQDANLVDTGASAGASITASISGAAYNSVAHTGVDLLGTVSLDAVGGVATFSNLRLEGVAGSYTLTFAATAPAEVSAFTDAQAIALAAGTAAKLRTVSQPTDIVAGVSFGTTVTAEILDAFNNRALVADNEITPTLIDTASTPNTIATKTAVAAANGLTTFTGLTFAKAGAHKIVFSAADLTSTTSSAFEITNAAPHHLTWVTQPTGAKNGVALSPAPVLEVRDEFENPALVGAATTVAASIQPANTDVISVSGASATSNASARVTFANLVLQAKAGNYGLRFTAANGSLPINGTYLDTTSTVTIAQGDPENLNVLTPAAGGTSDAAFTTQPVIQIRDSANNLVLDELGKSAVVTATISAGGTLIGAETATAVNSVATFADLGIKGLVSGSYTITYTIDFAGTAIAVDQTGITIGSGVATSLEVVQPAEVANAAVFATQPVITAKDSAGNIATTQVGTVAVANDNLTGTKTKALVSGVANFSGQDLKLTGTIGTYPLTYTMGSLTTISSVTLKHGVATKLILSTEAAGFTNRENFLTQPVIAVQDESGNRVLDSAVAVEVSIGSATLTGATTVNALNGLATFVELGKFGAVGSKTLSFKATGLTDATQTFLLTHGAATKLELTTAASSAQAGIVFGGQPVVRVLDADDNLVNTGDNSSATIAVSTSAAAYNAANHTGADLLGTLTAPASAGVATFAGLQIDGVAATYSLSFSATAPDGITGFTAVTQSLTVAAGTQTALRTVAQPTDIIAGVAFGTTVTVEILDAFNNRVLDATNEITPTLIDSALLPATVDSTKTAVAAVDGLATFTGLTFTKAGSHKVLFTATNLPGADLTSTTSSAFIITNAAPHHLTWITQPTGAKNDVALSPTPVLEVRDEFENPALVGDATTVAATIQPANTDVISVSGASATTNASARVTFSSLTLQAKIGNYGLRFTAANGTLPINGTHIDTTSTVAITHGDPTQLAITTPAAAAKAGFAFGTQPVVEVRDSAGNLVLDSALTITASMTNREVIGTATAVASNGVATFVNLGLNGASATGLQLNFDTTFNTTEIATSQPINLAAGAAIEVVMTQQPATVKTRDAFTIAPSVTLLDLWQNPVLSDNETQVTAQLIDSTGASVGAKSSPVTAVGGTVTFSTLAFTATPATGYRIKFEMAAAGDTVTSETFAINPGTATKLLITRQPATLELDGSKTKTGEILATQPIVKLYDQDDNLVTTANSGSATVSINSGAGASLSEGSTTANFVGGIATFAGVKLVGTPNAAYTLEFASSTPNPALTSAASNAISVMHNDAHHLVLTEAAATGRAGDIFGTQPQVTIQDRYSNTVTTGTGAGLIVKASAEVTAPTAAAATLIGGTQKNAIAGVATFGSLGIGGSTANIYKINFSISSSTVVAASQSDIQITYGYSDRVVMVTEPVGGNATGDALATQPVVAIQDAYGNLVADAADTVTASIVSTAGLTLADASVARLTGESVNAANGTATFTDLKLFGLPTTSYRLQFTIGQNPATASAVSVTHAAAHHATIVTQPVGGNATGSNLAGQPVVELRDQFENIVTSNNTDVLTAHLASASGTNLAGSSTDPERLAGSTTATFSAGIATFAGLKVIALPETLYTLNFDANVSSTPIASAISTTFGVTYSTATKLVVFQQPVANVTAELLTTQPIIEVQDIYGNRVRNYVGTVAVTLPQAGSTLSNSTYAGEASQFEAIIADGRATFSGLEITAIPGTDYQLNFASAPLTSINSGNLRVIAAAPFEVLMVSQPIGAQTNEELSGQPVVRVVDRFGNTVLSDNSTVITASIIDGAGGVLSRVSGGVAQPLTATVAAGAGTFDHLRFRGVSLRNYKLTFEAAGLAAANSNNFFVTHADASKLIFITQPVAGATGLPLPTQPVLELRDFDENLAATDSSSVVTASITSGDGSGTLTNATATANEGVVSFANLTLTGTPGVAYQITFTGDLGVLGTVTSLPSGSVVPLHGAPNQLAMRGTAVIGGLVGEDLVAQPKLNVLDSFGNLATTDNLTVVTASILADSTGAVLGTTTATAVNGLVDFSGLKATGTPGTAYTLRFSATSSGTNLATADSSTFTLSKQADVTLSYVAQAYEPDALVAPVFATDSPGVVTYSTTSEADVCVLNTVTGEITIKGAGTCSVNVSVAATEFYLANATAADLEISKARQLPITITSASTVNYWGTLYPAATGGSGSGTSLMSFAVNGDCKLVANTVIPGDAGSRCRLTATVPGDENYLPESSATQTIQVLKINQAPLMMASSGSLKVGTLNLLAAGGSGTGAVSYLVATDSANTANCSIVGTVMTATTNGTCSVKAIKAASVNYNVVETLPQSISVTKQEQSVAFTSTVPMYPVALGTYTPTATASSALAVGFTLITDAQNPACEFDPLNRAKVVFLIAGECTVVAGQGGNEVFSAASASQVIQVGILNQSIVFAAITDKPFGTPGFMISATSNSGLPVSLATTSDSTACTVGSNGLVSLVRAGLCEISATQAGNLTYGPASAVVRSFNVAADLAGAPQIVSVSSASQAFTASFTAPSYNGGSPILGYQLVLTDVNGQLYTNSACGTVGSPVTCTVVGLPNDIAYTAKVAAVTVAGIGNFSTSSVAQTPIEAPLAVTNLAATPDGGTLVVNWDVPTVSDTVFLSEFQSYQVYVAPIGTDFSTVPSATITQASATSTTIALSDSTPVAPASFGRASFGRASISTPTPTPTPTASSVAGYNIRVVTVTSSAVVSTNDNTTNGVQIGFAVPFAPAQMMLNPITTSLWISWSAPTADGGQPVLNYDVRVNGELVCPATTGFECTYIGMTAGTTYNVQVFARSEAGLSPAAVDSYSVPAPPAPQTEPAGPVEEVSPSPEPSPSTTTKPPVVPSVKPTARPTVKPTASPIAKPAVGVDQDIDGDGIINNEDSDIDGDGIANGLDDDIDGDGKPNDIDGDPAGTNGGGLDAPDKVIPPVLPQLQETANLWLLIAAIVAAFSALGLAIRKRRKSK